MGEEIEIFDLNSKHIGVRKRADYYKEIKIEFANTGKISTKIQSIRLILMNAEGNIYVQKRSKMKGENPGLYDKTIGGHVVAGTSFDLTLIKECAEELGFPIAILRSEEFKSAVKTTDLSVIGICTQIDYDENFESIRKSKDNSEIIMPYMNTFYIGYYNGSLRFSDGESSGIEVFTLNELQEEIAQNPSKFTHDIMMMVKTYEDYLQPMRNL